ncbi:avidin-like [Rhinatrema bivittatum]|uniref:avidin-like n=1 Tax=Rhinatrema bivittatum TaxID=194408 RepID=UPI0011282185|nr:avidin-like [Rhinatrema bivittatum]
MEKSIILCGIQLLVLMSFCCSTDAQCPLTGRWRNDLQSNMTISQVDENGFFTGTYYTSVSLTNKTILESPLIGFQQLRDQPTFAFSVKWKFSVSMTSFVGQYYKDPQGQELLVTMWLLREEAEYKYNWAATRVGINTFYRIQ